MRLPRDRHIWSWAGGWRQHMNIQLLKHATPVLRLRLVTDGTQTHIYRRLLLVMRSIIRRMHDYKSDGDKHILWKQQNMRGKAWGFEWVSHHVDGWVHMCHQDALWEECKLLEGGWAMTSTWMLFWNSIPPSVLFQTMYVCQVTSNELFKEIKQAGNITWANEGMINYEQKLVS